MTFKLLIYAGCFSVTFLSSCSHNVNYRSLDESAKKPIHSAVCSATNFLQKNGYIERLPHSAKNSISLEMWDNINYESDGVFDWERLLSDRAGTFENGPFGVKHNDDEYLVFYKFDDSFRCVSVYPNENKASLREANCLLSNEVIRMPENDIRCIE